VIPVHTLLYRLGTFLEEDFDVPEQAQAVYERALALAPDDLQLEEKITRPSNV